MTPIEMVIFAHAALALAQQRLADELRDRLPGDPAPLALKQRRMVVSEAAQALQASLDDVLAESLENVTPTCEVVPEAKPTPLVDEVFASEAAVVFQGHGGLDKEYPGKKGPIEIVAAMLSERNILRAFKARVEAGIGNP